MIPEFSYAYFKFKSQDGVTHDLRVWVTSSISLEWKLYTGDVQVGRHLDTSTNIMIPAQLNAALSYTNVCRIYTTLLETGGDFDKQL